MAILPTTIHHQMIDAGLKLPDDIRRIVIDIQANEIIKVYYESNASQKMMDIVIESLARNQSEIEVIDINESQSND